MKTNQYIKELEIVIERQQKEIEKINQNIGTICDNLVILTNAISVLQDANLKLLNQ